MKMTGLPQKFVRMKRFVRSALALVLMLGFVVLAWRFAALPREVLANQGIGNYAKDGDSIDVRLADGTHRIIRLFGVDAPELHQICTTAGGAFWPCGVQAQTALAASIKNTALTCNISANDQFSRSLATCSTTAMADVGAHLVRNGWAVSGVEKSGSRWENGGPYLLEQAQAQKARRGIWQGEFQRPADWRVDHSR